MRRRRECELHAQYEISPGRKLTQHEVELLLAKKILPARYSQRRSRWKFSPSRVTSDFGVVVEGENYVIFFLTSLFNDSRFQTVATNDRCESMNNGKGE
jgi:hypothetical protein